MANLNCRVVLDSHEVLDFDGEDGAKVHLERTKAYVFLPEAQFPDMVMLQGILMLGEGTVNLQIDVKKEKLRARLDLDSLKVTKPAQPKAA